jgi:hypothetical protein
MDDMEVMAKNLTENHRDSLGCLVGQTFGGKS